MTSKSPKRFKIKPPAFDDFAWASQSARVVYRAFQLLIREAQSPVKMPLCRTLRGWRLGFGKMANLVYGLDSNDPQLYVSQVQQVIFSPRINGHYDHLLNNKLLFPKLMDSIGIESPSLIAFTRRGMLQTNEGDFVQRPQEWIVETLKLWEKIVLKPIKGQKGRGLAFVELRQGSLSVNGVLASPSEVAAMIQQAPESIITEFVSQAEYARTIYSKTANTIRVLTIWDYRSGQPFIAAAAQRIGTERSFPADNWQAGIGGLSCEVELETGRLSKAATVSPDWKLRWYDQHPETGSQIEGLIVPGWRKICRQLVKAACQLAWTPQIAWDILVTDEEFKVIEINGSPGYPVHQVHRPLLEDMRIRDFFRRHRVIGGSDPQA